MIVSLLAATASNNFLVTKSLGRCCIIPSVPGVGVLLCLLPGMAEAVMLLVTQPSVCSADWPVRRQVCFSIT